MPLLISHFSTPPVFNNTPACDNYDIWFTKFLKNYKEKPQEILFRQCNVSSNSWVCNICNLRLYLFNCCSMQCHELNRCWTEWKIITAPNRFHCLQYQFELNKLINLNLDQQLQRTSNFTLVNTTRGERITLCNGMVLLLISNK